jgi:hypothetical protein
MPTNLDKVNNKKFVTGQHYKFEPFIKTNCIAVNNGDQWEQKIFSEGWCLGYDKDSEAFIFQGKPVGESEEHYFFVTWGENASIVAKNIEPPHLRVVT